MNYIVSGRNPRSGLWFRSVRREDLPEGGSEGDWDSKSLGSARYPGPLISIITPRKQKEMKISPPSTEVSCWVSPERCFSRNCTPPHCALPARHPLPPPKSEQAHAGTAGGVSCRKEKKEEGRGWSFPHTPGSPDFAMTVQCL